MLSSRRAAVTASRTLEHFNLASCQSNNNNNTRKALSLASIIIRRAAALDDGAKRQVATLSLLCTSNNNNHTNDANHLWLAAGVSLVAGSTTAATASLAEEQQENTVPSTVPALAVAIEEEEEEEDPYENLPEEDEPTECSMCNTFRQGPCRPFWRKLERCFKDHEGQENGASICMRYFMPHQKCLMNYTNLYNLVRLTSLQEYIDETEEALPARQRAKMSVPTSLDWSLWREFQNDAGPQYAQGLEKAAFTKRTPLWKRFAEDTEPVVLTFNVQIPRQEEDGLLLRFAYVVDQDGMVLGVESNPRYRKFKDEVEGRKKEEKEEEEETDVGPEMKLEFYVIPSMTQEIKIKAMYAKDPRTPGLKGDGSDDVLKETSPVNLSKVS